VPTLRERLRNTSHARRCREVRDRKEAAEREGAGTATVRWCDAVGIGRKVEVLVAYQPSTRPRSSGVFFRRWRV